MGLVSDIRLISSDLPAILPMEGRSEGIHISQIIHDLCVRLGYFEGDLPPNQLWMELGNALEHAMVQRFQQQWPDRYIQPGELELDGLFGTPDLLNLDDYANEEIKLAWMSASHEPDGQKMWRYWAQVKAYCKMLDTNIGRLHVCFVNGDYKTPGPAYRLWEWEFTQRELDENWAMLLSTAKRMEAERG